MLILCYSFVTYAYTTNGYTIESTNKLTFLLHSGFTTTSSQHFSDAVSAWTGKAGVNVIAKSSSTHTETSYPNNDGKNYVYRMDTGTGDYLGQTQGYVSGGYRVNADININMHFAWANSAQPDCYDTGSVLLHELGHVMGLDHSANTDAVMYKSLSTNKVKRTLQTDDINGVQSLY